MAKKQSQTEEPKYNINLPSGSQQPVSPQDLARLEQARQAEMATKVRKILEEAKSKADSFVKEAVEKFKKDIIGISLLPPKAEGQPFDLLVLLQTEGTFEEKFKRKDEIDKKLREIAQKKLPSNILSSTIALEEIWEMCLKGKYDVLSLLSMGMPLYDSGWLGALRATEIHKSMVLKKFEKYVVSYVLAGSLVRGEAHSESDVDTFIVIDDTDVTRMTAGELVSKLRAIIWGMAEEASMAAGVKNKLNVQIYILTDMWNSIKSAVPTIFTFLRDGVPLYDRGMFAPWKLLLKQGKITPTPEAVDAFMKSGTQVLDRTKWKLKEIAIDDFFWATLTPTQGALMLLGVSPPTPNETATAMKEHLVKTGLLEDKWVKLWDEILQLRKDLEHGKIKDVPAKKIDELIAESEKYISRLEKLFKQIETQSIKKETKALHEKTIEDITAALKMVDVKATESEAVKLFEQHFITKKFVPTRYLDLIKKIVELQKDQKATRAEISSLSFEQERLARETFDRIRAEKGKQVEKYKISASYGDKKADVWLLTDAAFIVLDTSRPDTQIKKYSIEKDGALASGKSSNLKELNETVEKFAGTPTTLTKQTIESLKEILGEDIKLVVGA